MYLFLLKNAYENNRYDFSVSDVAISNKLSLTRKTVKVTKEKLQKFGLITFKNRNGIPCYYRLLLNYPLPEIHSDVNIYDSMNDEIYIESEETEHLPQISDVPDFDMFLEYASALETYSSELEPLVKGKYKLWIDNGWKNNFNRPITNWRSSLKSAMPFLNELLQKDFTKDTIPAIKRPKLPLKNDKPNKNP